MYLSAPLHEFSAHSHQERAFGPPELESPMVVSHHVGPGNLTLGLSGGATSVLTAEPSRQSKG